MSNKLFSLLAVVMVLGTLVACGQEQVQVTRIVEQTVVETVVSKETVVETIVITATPEEVVATAPPQETPPDRPTWQWPTSSPQEQGMNPELLSAMLDHIEQTGTDIHNIVIIRDGYMILDEHYYDSASASSWRSSAHNTPHPLCSCTKSIVSILIGMAIDQGYIEGVDQPVLSFFPEKTVENLTARKEAMTLKDLLTMSAGFRCGDESNEVLEWMIESGNQLQYILDLPMQHRPGTHFEYCNAVSHLLSAIIENTTGMSTSVFAYEHLFRPLGITTLTWGVDYHGITLGYTDIFMAPYDMAKIGLLYLNQGRWNGEQIVSAAWVAESTREHMFADDIAERYGYQWWVDPDGYYFAVGRGGQFIFVVPQHNLVAVFTSELYGEDIHIPKRLLDEYIIPAAETPLPTATEPAVASDTWIKTYGGNRDVFVGGMLLADDGGYFIVGTTYLEFEPEPKGDVYLLRLDAAGEVLWEETYGGEGNEVGLTLTRAGDGNLLIVGVTTSFDAEGMDVYLLKVDQDGNEIWSKTYGGPLDEFVGAIGQTQDAGFVLGGNIVDPNDVIADPGAAGYGGFEGRSNLYLLKIDAQGDEVWSRAYESENNVLASGGAFTQDGGFLALATVTYFPDPNDDMLLVKLDENGNEVWSRTWEEGIIRPYDLIQTSDGNYLITASYKPLEGAEDLKEDFCFIKIDPDGNEIWRSVFGDADTIDYGVVLAESTDGGYVTAGERTRDHYTWDADITWVKIDASGQLVWEESRTVSHTIFSTILQHPDGGFVIAGAAFRQGVFNILLIKTDGEGNVAD